ncbi:hypothetical protein VTL71DRAFT_4599 [Oculimacula yallundae]|uniref:Uncharacterized protein n=1 Tax=Oculimacula yallundae TaxID=86028 RepID=A0ABR4C322_9HELO
MHFISVGLLASVPLVLGYPILHDRQGITVTPVLGDSSNLTPQQTQDIICQSFRQSGPAITLPVSCRAPPAVPTGVPSDPSPSTPVTTSPIPGAGGLGGLTGVLGGLLARDELVKRQNGGSSNGGGVDLGAGGLPGFIAGLAGIPNLSGVTGSVPEVLGTLQSVGGFFAKRSDMVNDLSKQYSGKFWDALRAKGKRALEAFTAVLGGLPVVGDLLGVINPSGLPIVGSGGGISSLNGLPVA